MSLLIKNGTILTATSKFTGDLYIEGEAIRQIGSNLNMDTDRIVGAAGKYVLPEGVDEHIHCGSFGGRLFETTEAAAVGGATTIVDFAPQEKDVPLLDAIRRQTTKAEDISSVDLAFHAVIMSPKESVFEEVRHLSEMRVATLRLLMAYKGTAFYCDNEAVLNAMMNAKETSVTVVVHAENADVITILTNHYLSQREAIPMYHCHAHPPITEEEATGRVVALAEAASYPLFMIHVSAKEAVEAIRKAHSQGWSIFGEACTHYLTLTTGYLNQPGLEGVKYICSLPLKPQEHVDALWQAVQEGWLTTVGSDHYALDGGFEEARKKGTNFSNIPDGYPGVQDRLALLWTYGVYMGTITRQKFVGLSATNLTKVVGLPSKGGLRTDADADVVIFDPEWEGAITNKDSLHGTDHEPFEGFRIQGRPEQVYLRGRLVAENGVSVGEHGKGKWQRCQPYELCYDYYHE